MFRNMFSNVPLRMQFVVILVSFMFDLEILMRSLDHTSLAGHGFPIKKLFFPIVENLN